jgi:uncharacterized membrane protein YsdA (DUF1294 family)
VHISAFPRSALRPVLGEVVVFEIETESDGRSVARRAIADRLVHATAPHQEPPAPRRRSRFQRMLGVRRPASFDYLAIVAFVLIYVGVSFGWPTPPWVLGVYLGTSILSFIFYAVDKKAATRGGWRISESSLLALGIIGGWPGAIIGQQVFRHKTRKPRFRSAFGGTVLLNVLAFVTFSVVLSSRLRGTP